MAQYVMKPQVNVKCAFNKCFGGLKILSGNKYYDPLDDNRLTLDYIFKNASDEELEAIVHSIVGRLWEQQMKNTNFITRKKRYHNRIDIGVLKPTDKELHEVTKGLRKPQ